MNIFSYKRLWAACALLSLGAGTAHAQEASSSDARVPAEQESALPEPPEETSDTSEAAAMLFARARAWMKAARYDEACTAFEKSQRLDPASGTLLNLGACREAQGRIASAYECYRRGLALSQLEQNSDGERIASKRIAALEPKLSRVALSIQSPRPGLTVRLDGTLVDPKSWGSAMPVDPGSHQLESSGPNQRPWSITFSIERAALRTLNVESPPPTASSAQPAAAAREVARGSNVQPRSSASGSKRLSWPLLASVGASGVGVLGTLYFGYMAKQAWHTRNEHCPDNHCDHTAVTASRNAARYARVADVAVGLAAVGGLALVSLVIFEPRTNTGGSEHQRLRLESRGADIELRGTF